MSRELVCFIFVRVAWGEPGSPLSCPEQTLNLPTPTACSTEEEPEGH